MYILDQKTGNVLVQFDTYIDSSYHNSNGVAFEPLEKGTFSNDSQQNSPFLLTVTGVRVINSNPNRFVETVDQTRQALEQLTKSTTLVTVSLQPMLQESLSSDSQYYQYGSVYQNLKLFDVSYQNSADQLEFRPTMVFQEVRLTTTEYTQSQNTANPENSAIQNQGQKQPQSVNSSLLNKFKNLIFGG